jgi:ribosomal protein L1
MPAVATSFGKVLGPAGKMPSPQLGILPSEDEKPIKDLLGRINRIVKIKSKEPSLKITIGKEDLKDEELAENAVKIYTEVFKVLPRQKENIKSILIKFTMTKPIKIKTD